MKQKLENRGKKYLPLFDFSSSIRGKLHYNPFLNVKSEQ